MSNADENEKKRRKQLKEIENQYRQALENENEDTIEKAIKFLHNCKCKVKSKKNVKLDEELVDLDEETKRIFELMKQYQRDILTLFTSTKGVLTHITSVAPENMVGGKIKKSISRQNHYETERGDWLYVSSSPIDGNNPYTARNAEKGLIIFAAKSYIYGGNIMQVDFDEQGNSKVTLRNPNYIYMIYPVNFTPVVTLMLDKNGRPYFHFSEEWFSTEDIDINDSKQICGIQEISDVTEVIKNFQVACTENIREIAKLDIDSRMGSVIEGIKNGSIRYINGEAGINVSKELQNARASGDIKDKADTVTEFVQE